jgi:hypothetical protein
VEKAHLQEDQEVLEEVVLEVAHLEQLEHQQLQIQVVVVAELEMEVELKVELVVQEL